MVLAQEAQIEIYFFRNRNRNRKRFSVCIRSIIPVSSPFLDQWRRSRRGYTAPQVTIFSKIKLKIMYAMIVKHGYVPGECLTGGGGVQS